jgi:starch-binding outer membrane protein, SusD/RagB family
MYKYMYCRMTLSLLASFTILLISCEQFVEVGAPKSKIESDVVFSNDVTATSAVLGIYSKLMDPSGFTSGTPYSVLALTGLSGDELMNYSNSSLLKEFENNSIDPTNFYTSALWKSLYESIYQANAILEGINSSSGMSGPVRDQLKGEALFVRAFCYFYLTNLYGDVPLVTTSDYRTNSAIPRTDSELVYNQILEDLKYSRDFMSAKYVAAYGERVRPNKFSASALLARVYLYKRDWHNAELMASEVIGESGLYVLVDSVADVFLANGMESIWQLQPLNNGDYKGATNEAIYFSSTDQNVLSYNVLRQGVYKDFESGDRRFRNWIEHTLVDSDLDMETPPDTVYFPRKYKHDNLSEYMTEYSSVLRLAEQYLIRAEARAMQNNVSGPNSAEEDVNAIRIRAGLAPIGEATQSLILAAIVKERRLELIAEGGHRWFDLKRLNFAESVLSDRKVAFNHDDELYPIPASEFRNNPLLKRQNSGY